MNNNLYKKIKEFLPDSNVLLSKEERYCYSADAWNLNDSQKKVPDVVVFVETTEDVQKILRYAHDNKIPVIPRGAGTNMVGACVCEESGIILNFSKMNKILNINQENMTATVQPGVVIEALKSNAEKYNLFFPPDPSSYKVATIGGAIAQSSGGAMSFKYGTIKDYVLSLKIVTSDGNLVTLGCSTAKDATGYHLAQLMIGSEGTLGIIVEATLKLIAQPESKCVIVAYFNNLNKAVSVVGKIVSNNIMPAAIDFMDMNSVKAVANCVDIDIKTSYPAMLLIELDGLKSSMQEQISIVKDILSDYEASEINVSNNEEEYNNLWNARRISYASVTKLAPDVISDDIIVPREKLPEIVQSIQEIYSKYELKLCLVGHVADGNLHPQVALNLDNKNEIEKYKMAQKEMYSKVIQLGGTISAEHGIGIAKRNYLTDVVDNQVLEYMKAIKKAFDSENILNPGKIFKL